jgi:preprotein translocase subunit SecE
MSIIKNEDSAKWINAFVAFCSVVIGFVVTRFTEQLAIWFDLEAKVSNFYFLNQLFGLAVGLVTFVYLIKFSKAHDYLKDVYNELLKVIWPSHDTTTKMTVGIGIALVVVASVFVSIDFIFKKVLSFVY